MVPVLDRNKMPLMPCSEKRARKLMERGEAKPYYQKQIFCIMLLKEPRTHRYQDVAATSDPGSKREGYTVATAKSVVMNVTTNTKDWVKAAVETRRMLRRSRRQRKTPYRACRYNRAVSTNPQRIPSTFVRWNTKLNMLKFLQTILPITIVNVEDIKAVSKECKDKWNKSFSPLEIGKEWFYEEIVKLGIKLIKTKGFDTYSHRKARGFAKTKGKHKLDYVWESHNSDSHSLAEIALGTEIKPFLGLYRIDFLQFNRRQLQVQSPTKGNFRKKYGSTVSLGMSRGSFCIYRDKFCFLGGTSNNRVSLHSVITGKRITQIADPNQVKVIHTTKQRTQFIPRINPWVSLQRFS